MHDSLIIGQRELSSIFKRPFAYTILILFSLINGYLFYTYTIYYAQHSAHYIQAGRLIAGEISIHAMILYPFYQNLSFLFLIITPLFTMRQLAEEKKSGNWELLCTYPISLRSIVLGKFLGSFSFLSVLLGFTLIYPVALMHYAQIEWPIVLTSWWGLTLLIATGCSVGIWASALTENQVIASLIAFSVLIACWSLSWLGSLLQPEIAPFFNLFSLVINPDYFLRGLPGLFHTLFYIGLTAVFLYAAEMSLTIVHHRS